MVKTNKLLWFTLVELIVVITILAILGTIGFLSFGSYSADARDAKRSSDLKNLQSSIVTKKSQGANLMSFASGVTQNQIAATAYISGTGVTNSYDYEAGTINFASLDISSTEFSDPQNSLGYRIGVTSKLSGKYQLAAQLENAGTPTAQVLGDFSPRNSGAGIAIDNTVSTDTTAYITSVTNFNKFKIGDWVGCTTATIAAASAVTAISADGGTLTLSGAFSWDCDLLRLGTSTTARPEPTGLIDDGSTPAASGSTEVIDGGTSSLPY